MYIASFRIENYKSFRATDVVNLTPGFNVIVGQNNVGKTALIEALSLNAPSKPHRSMKSLPTPTTPLPANSVVEVSFVLGRSEFIDVLRGLPSVWVPNPEGTSPSDRVEKLKRALESDVQTLRCAVTNGGVSSTCLESFGPDPQVGMYALARVIDASGNVELAQPGISGVSAGNRFDYQSAGVLKSLIYAFRAERLNVGAHKFGSNIVLRTDAANLPEVLNHLQGSNPERFQRLNRFVQTIFPIVRRVTVRPLANDNLEIVLWTVDPATERGDLAIPLTESGTGIGQVLAMLYVVLTADSPRVILIDEPQSFLHPGAVRKLIEILKEHPQHQFIITTHSPTALLAADPGTLLRLRVEEGQTIIDLLDVAQTRDLRLVLADVGARLSDVFGADSILWVEGATEELCFPKIAAPRGVELRGTVVIGVVQTGDFEGRRSATTIEIYRRLSASRGLLPPAVGFIFDREGRTDQERRDLEQYGNVSFLPRRMYENYLLNPAAIAAVASGIQGFRDSSVTQGEVEAWLAAHDPLPGKRDDTSWLREVRADRLLGQLFSQLSEGRVQYDKVRHGAALTDWLLQHAPGELQELVQLIAQALGRPGA